MTALDSRVAAVLSDGAHDLLAHGVPGALIGLRTAAGEAIGCAGSATPALPPPSDLAAARPLTAETAFDIASITKVLATTTSLLRLVSAGDLALDERIERFLPAFSGGAKSQVTVRDLLAHRGGLQPWHPLYLAAAVNDAARADPLRFALELSLAGRPGRERIYSDLGFMALGRVVEVVTGRTLREAVTALVLDPLGLHDTAYAHPLAGPVAASSRGDEVERRMVDTGVPYPVPYRATDFAGWRERMLVGEVNDGNAFHAFAGVSGHAGLFSTPADLLAFGLALSDHSNRDDLWNPRVVEEFFSATDDPAQAFGFRRYEIDLDSGPVTALGHPGFTGVAVGFVPGASLAFVIATNRLLGPNPQPPANDALWQQAIPVVRDAVRASAAPTRPSASRE
jgi:CubicO group peptidase (beta-lactamase class C family)